MHFILEKEAWSKNSVSKMPWDHSLGITEKQPRPWQFLGPARTLWNAQLWDTYLQVKRHLGRSKLCLEA